jgi:hypothetical protein
LCSAYGRVTNCLIMVEKGQAFVEMESVEVASTLLDIFEQAQPSIRLKPIIFQFSRYTSPHKSQFQTFPVIRLSTVLIGAHMLCIVVNKSKTNLILKACRV